MKLKALDQVHVSSVKADSLQPGEEFEVSATLGKQMLAKRPGVFELVEDDEAPAEKAEPAPENKAEPAAPANKASKKGK